jgi:hypothetical protein
MIDKLKILKKAHAKTQRRKDAVIKVNLIEVELVLSVFHYFSILVIPAKAGIHIPGYPPTRV